MSATPVFGRWLWPVYIMAGWFKSVQDWAGRCRVRIPVQKRGGGREDEDNEDHEDDEDAKEEENVDDLGDGDDDDDDK